MAHAATGRRRLTCDKAYDWLFHVLQNILGCNFFGVATDLADHNHGFGLRMLVEKFERVGKICTNDRIAADSNRRRLTNPARRKLIHSLVSKGTRARNDPNRTLLMDATWHDPNLALSRRN